MCLFVLFKCLKKTALFRSPAPAVANLDVQGAGVYIIPKNWVFYKSLFGGLSFFINNNGQFFYKKKGSFL